MKNIDNYVISLPTAVKRRENIQHIFNSNTLSFKFIEAINGKEIKAEQYFQLAKNPNFWFNRRHIISPSEVGCRLSHLQAINEFINNSKKEWVIIFEDDINFKISFMSFLNDLNNTMLQEPTIIHLGGQEGLRTINRVIMRSYTKIPNLKIKKVNNLTLRWLYRTCSYALNRKAAMELIEVHNQFTFVADDWSFILKKSNIKNIFFSDHITHPIDISDSSIQAERI